MNLQMKQVPEGMEDACHADPAEGEGQDVAEAEVVIDRRQQHHQQRHCEDQPEAGRQHEYPTLHQPEGQGLRGTQAQQPAIDEGRDAPHNGIQRTATSPNTFSASANPACSPPSRACRRCAATCGNTA